MVTYVKDRTGRFQQRPYYKPEELDRECEGIVTTFLKGLYGDVRYPVSTDDLTKLIERDAESLDLYADLSEYGRDVEGVTEFNRGRKPRVLISTDLGLGERRENRLRTTLTHEYGHVKFHGYLWEVEPLAGDLLGSSTNWNKVICKRDSIIDASQTDWMEWQAGYICGAILMPKSAVAQICSAFVEPRNLYPPMSIRMAESQALIKVVMKNFQVSEHAARVRLLKLGVLTDAAPSASLFV
jgi:hypothetical protein